MPDDDLDRIRTYLARNRDSYNENLTGNHTGRFLRKLNSRFRHMVSIVPYLLKVAVATVVIFTASIIIWDNYIRRDRNEVTLAQKVTSIFKK